MTQILRKRIQMANHNSCYVRQGDVIGQSSEQFSELGFRLLSNSLQTTNLK